MTSKSSILYSLVLLLSGAFTVRAQTVPAWGNTLSFAIVAATTVTATVADTVTGDIGISPGTSLTGFPPAVIYNGRLYSGAASLAGAAEQSVGTIYNNLMGQLAPPGNNLTGLVLGAAGSSSYAPGIYSFASTAQLTGTLTLNDGGNPDAIYIFQIGSAFNSAAGSAVKMSSGGAGKNVFWVMGTSATMGASCSLIGNLVAHTSVSMGYGAGSTGKILAWTGAVTINYNNLNAFPLTNTRIWTGNGSTATWSDPANWYGHVIPTAATDVYINQAATLLINGAAAANSLTFNNTQAVLKIAAGTGLTLSGNLTMNAGTLITASAFPAVHGTTMLNGGSVWFAGNSPQTIPSGTYTNLEIDNPGLNTAGSDITVSGNLTLKKGILDMGKNYLKLGSGLADSAALINSKGTLELNGTASQYLTGSYFTGGSINSLTINNTSGVWLTTPVSITGLLVPLAGQLTTGGNLALLSGSGQTAAISASGSGTVSGLVSLQRYLQAGFGYKYFSSPFTASTVGNFAPAVALQAKFPNFYSYSENQAGSGFNIDTASGSALLPMHGYAADLGPDSLPQLITLTGTVNNGPLSLTVTNSKWPTTLGFNLVGNPYPSAIDWDATQGWSNKNIDNALYYYDSGSASPYYGSYTTFVNKISSDGNAGNIIGSMQGFFIHVSDNQLLGNLLPATGTFAMNNLVRVDSLSPYFHKATLSRNRSAVPLIRISAGFDRGDADQTVVYGDEFASAGFNKVTDAVKLMNTAPRYPNIYLVGEDGSRLAIKALHSPGILSEIKLGIELKKEGIIIFRISTLSGLPPCIRPELTDQATGIAYDLGEERKAKIYLDRGVYNDRFILRLKPAAELAVHTRRR